MAGRGDDEVVTAADKATLSGGRGDDVLHGKGAANTYLYAAGDGSDVIKDGSVIVGSGGAGALGPLGASTISFGKGITAADIWLSAEAVDAGSQSSGSSAVPLTGRNLVVNIGSATSATTLPAGRIAQAVNDSWFVAPSKERRAA